MSRLRPSATCSVLAAILVSASLASAAAARPSDRRHLVLRTTFRGPISPKSVASSGRGLVLAQNMMYRLTITVYDMRRLWQIRTISDEVRLSRSVSAPIPVRSTARPWRRRSHSTAGMPTSNSSMYGAGFGGEGADVCTPSSGYGPSFVYRVDLRDLRDLKITDAYRVGPVTKVVAVTPDGRYVLAANWCGYDPSVISVKQRKVVLTVPIGPYPRGIAITPKGGAAYIAVMGSDHPYGSISTTGRPRTFRSAAAPEHWSSRRTATTCTRR